MKILSILTFYVSLSFCFTNIAYGADIKPTYFDAGCGLGGMLFDSPSKTSQILAVTTNQSFGSQTFGITSGTSGCGTTKDPSTNQLLTFIKVNQSSLLQDLARGQGETLETLLLLYEVQPTNMLLTKLQQSTQHLISKSPLTPAVIHQHFSHSLISYKKNLLNY